MNHSLWNPHSTTNVSWSRLSVFELHKRPRGGGHLRLCQQVPRHDSDDKGATSPPATTAKSVRPPEDVPDGLTQVVQAHLAGDVFLGRTEIVFETLPIWVRAQRSELGIASETGIYSWATAQPRTPQKRCALCGLINKPPSWGSICLKEIICLPY